MVARVRKIFRIRAVGHTGTLDPFASGLLLVLLGPATRLARFAESSKTYRATARLGVRTATDDPTGEVLERRAVDSGITEAVVRGALLQLLGPQRQRPPVFSAKKVAGERSYAKARRGEAVALAAVEVMVHSIDLVNFRSPELTFRATVGPGTYLRALARDLGERLGCGAHLTALRREAIGAFTVERAVPLEELSVETPLLNPLEVLGRLPTAELDAAGQRAVAHGRPVPDPRALEGVVALVREGTLLAVAEAGGGWFRPIVVLVQA